MALVSIGLLLLSVLVVWMMSAESGSRLSEPHRKSAAHLRSGIGASFPRLRDGWRRWESIGTPRPVEGAVHAVMAQLAHGADLVWSALDDHQLNRLLKDSAG